jgi:protein-L-isoaspartate(D-aspartate) O-methyltransferase
MKSLVKTLVTVCIFTVCVLYSGDKKEKEEKEYPRKKERLKMIEEQIQARGVKDERVLKTMKKVPRHLFIPEERRDRAYEDYPVSIGYGQTISQPYIVAVMTELLKLPEKQKEEKEKKQEENNNKKDMPQEKQKEESKRSEDHKEENKEQTKPAESSEDKKEKIKVLEIGTGSGYQAAVLSDMVDEVYSIEIIPELAERAKKTLQNLAYSNIYTKQGDGYFGWEKKGPFDAIIVTAATPTIPPPLIKQLKKGGRMIIPVGAPFSIQWLVLLVKDKEGKVYTKNIMAVTFVPFTREKTH